MRRRCKHEEAMRSMRHHHGPPSTNVTFLWCPDCNEEWLPLGAARDTEQTVIEVRACEQALKHDSTPKSFRWNYLDDSHCNCWYEADGPCCRCGFDGDVDGVCEVGYLARVIVEHTEDKP